jgi:hypothetical protein
LEASEQKEGAHIETSKKGKKPDWSKVKLNLDLCRGCAAVTNPNERNAANTQKRITTHSRTH